VIVIKGAIQMNPIEPLLWKIEDEWRSKEFRGFAPGASKSRNRILWIYRHFKNQMELDIFNYVRFQFPQFSLDQWHINIVITMK